MLIILAVLFICSAFESSYSLNCESKQTCDECIREFDCDWCVNLKAADSSAAHCRPKNDTTAWCADQKISLPPIHEVRPNWDQDFSSDNKDPIQIRPQRIKLSLRKGEKFVLDFQYKRARNYPMDLYYLTDLSNSMKIFLTDLGNLGRKLADTMRNLTTNFKLGYGSFIDKSALPFATMENYRLKIPCPGCALSYSFKNHLPLTSDYDAFIREVKHSNFSGNQDNVEGGLDALMQVMVCKEKIGWRSKARHLIVFSTDALSHTAGDGKLAGIVEPNPAVCYNSDDDFLKYDYPSVSQISYVAKENNYNIIFAVIANTQKDKESYRALSESIKNSKYDFIGGTGLGRNVVDLIEENYKHIEEAVKFTSNASKAVDVKFSPFSFKIHVGELQSMKAIIQPRECLPKGTREYIWLKPEGLNDGLIVELEINCECPCSADSIKKSENCSGIGDLKCGVCSCPPGIFGEQCECDNKVSSSEDLTKKCIMPGSTVCSGLGDCNKCGKCECHMNGIYGQFCECNDYLCRKNVDGVQCSGKGTCKCNVCECQAGYTGEACECSENKDTCYSSKSAEMCSNYGECICGKCSCTNGYAGEFCQDCIACPDGHRDRCSQYHICVECKAYNTLLHKTNCEEKCKAFNVRKVKKLDENRENKTELCHEIDADGCMIHFAYYHVDQTINVEVFKECVHVHFLRWVLGVPIATLLLGLLSLMIWKVLVTIHDRREYEKFEKDRAAMKWGNSDNPLYVQATTTFANPAYNRNRASRISRNRHS